MSAALGSNDNSAASPTIRDADATANNFVFCYTPIAFSGNYPTGGDTLDLTPIAQALGISGGIANLLAAYPGGMGPPNSLTNVGGFYTFLKGSTLANGKVKIFKQGGNQGTEYTNGAYGTDVTTDVVILETIWRKGQ